MAKRLLPVLLCYFALAACSGAATSGVVPPPVAVKGPATTPQSISISIAIPAPSGAVAQARRRPAYVSVNTQSATVAVNGGTPVVVPLTTASGNCTTDGSGNRTCTATTAAPLGADTFAVVLYATTNGTGPILAQSTTTATIVAGQANTVALTLSGVIWSIAVSRATASPATGSPGTIPLTVTFRDASGAAIVGGDPFANPVTLTDSDTSSTTSLSATTLAKPSDAASLAVTYNGRPLTSAVFGAVAAGVPSTNVTTATLTPQSGGGTTPASFTDWPTYGFDAQRSGFNPATSGITPASLSAFKIAWHATTSGAAQTQPIVMRKVAGHAALVVVGGFPSLAAYDATSGALVWQTVLQKQDQQSCGQSGIAGTAQYDRDLNAIFVAGGNGQTPNHVILYRLDAGSGAITGRTDVTPTLLAGEAASARTAVTLANGRLYLGTGSNCEGGPGLVNWRGRVASVDPSSMALTGTFFTTWNQGGNFGGGGVWAWGGVSADGAGNIYVASGNAETGNTLSPQVATPPFAQIGNEQAGYAEHLVKLSADLSTVEDANYPGFNFQIGYDDLDYTGTPVIFTPPLSSGCGTLSATQGKGGELVVNSTTNLSATPSIYDLSVPSGAAYYIGNPAYSPVTGLLYAAISSSGQGSAMLPPGLAAIGGCASSMTWHAQFGPDSTAYGGAAHPPRSAPTVTSGGVVFMATPCTPDASGTTCGAPSGSPQGALWAVDATTGALLNNAKPLLITYDTIRMAPSADGLWLWVMDQSGNVYGLTVDPSVRAAGTAALRNGHRLAPTYRYRGT